MRHKVLYALSGMLMFFGGITQTQAALVYTFSEMSVRQAAPREGMSAPRNGAHALHDLCRP